jgi:hypothetical protein
MAQVRETFNPPSPHSSSGGADSYKHEGTPDTRLTAFSPEEGLTRSAKTVKPLNVGSSSEQPPVRFPVATPSVFRSNPIAVEKDPFVTSGTASTKSDRKLSATASTFRPISVPVVAYGSSPGLRQQSNAAGVDTLRSVSSSAVTLDIDVHPSRFMVISPASKNVDVTEVETYLNVSQP